MAVGSPSGGLCLTGAKYSTLLKWYLGFPCCRRIAQEDRTLYAGGGRLTSSATTLCLVRSRDPAIATLAHKPFFCQILNQSRVPHDREVDIAETDVARQTSCRRHETGDGTSRCT